jgi:hypothetical protein
MTTPPCERPLGLAAEGSVMVEAAGQRICLFRDRLDYAFTPTEAGGGACYPGRKASRILVPAPLE